MAQPVYDDSSDEPVKYGPRLDESENQQDGDKSKEKGSHKNTDDLASRESLFNPRGDKTATSTEQSPTSSSLASETSKNVGGGSLFNNGGDEKSGLRGKVQKLRAKAGGAAKNKWVIGGAVGASSLIIGIIVLIIFIGSLKLPQITENIETYEFAQVTQQFARTASQVTDESFAVSGQSDGIWEGLKTRFTSSETYQNIRDTTWGKLDAYRPSKVIETLGDTKGLEIRYKVGISNRARFVGATYNNVDYNVEPISKLAQWTPGVGSYLNKVNAAKARSQLLEAIGEDMKTSEVSTIVRGPVMYSIRKLAGGGFAGWALDQFKGKEGTDAQTEATGEMSQATEAGNTIADNAVDAEIGAADAAVDKALQADASNPAKVTADDAANGESVAADDAADAALKVSGLKRAVGIADPLYTIFAPICIIYDGSVQRSEPAIDDQMNQQEDSFDKLAAEADQQKTGDMSDSDAGELANAISGTNDEIGDVSQSIPYQQAATGISDSTGTVSPEAGSDDGYNYSLFNTIGVSPSSETGQILTSVTKQICTKLTSLSVGLGLAAINVGTAIASLGTAQTAEDSAGIASTEFADKTATTIAKNAIEKITASQTEKAGVKTIERSALNRAMRFAFKQGVVIGSTYGLTELARLTVAARSGEANNGLAQNTDLVNEAGSGGNIEANKIEQEQMFGRPLLPSEIAQIDQSNETYLTDKNSSSSLSNRYFATSNPQSLFSHIALGIDANLKLSIVGSLMRFGTFITKPIQSLGNFASLIDLHVKAAPSPSNEHYGNVQFGWPTDEDMPLENQQILDRAAQINSMPAEQFIAKTYANCFGYDYSASGNGDLDPTDTSGNLQIGTDASLGNLLANGNIVRDDNGNVLNQGECSKTNLSYNNPQYGDLVFRWRLAMRYDTTISTLINEQGVSGSSPSQT
jgi:hypothetical protein